MSSSRVEAFSDGVLAIIITIMVLELPRPPGETWEALRSVWLPLLSYVLSFVYVGIYWSNHHHMFQATRRVTGGILWANLHLLFWLSLVPRTTDWVGETHFAATPTAVYGVVLLLAALAYTNLERAIIRNQGSDSVLAAAVGSDRKGKVSIVLYVIAIAAAFFHPEVAGGIFAGVALMWLLPDRRIARVLAASRNSPPNK